MIAERHVGESVIVVTHGGVLQALYRLASDSAATSRGADTARYCR